MITEHLPVLVIVWTLLAGLMCSVFSPKERLFKYWGAFHLLVVNCLAFSLLKEVLEQGTIRYHLSGFAPPQGLELKVTTYNALLCVAISVVALFAFLGTHVTWPAQIGHRLPRFFTLWFVLLSSYYGLALSNDAFSLYVMLEVSSLATYGLIAFGGGRAYLATFNYIIMGTIGASFYLIGIGYFYITSGTLNLDDLAIRLAENSDSATVLIGLAFLVVGLLLKMAVFPLHYWLPNAYTFAPDATSCLVAPLSTKLAVFLLFHILYDIFGGLIPAPEWSPFVITVACVGILVGSSLALAQRNLKKAFACVIVAESGYMLGGLWITDPRGTVAALYHLLNDMIATLAMFLAAVAIIAATNSPYIKDMRTLFARVPWTSAALVVVALNMIGVPPTSGFFSKYLLISSAYASGSYGFVAALIFASLANAVLFFRVFETAFFPEPAPLSGRAVGKPCRGTLSTALLALLFGLLVIPLGLYNTEVIQLFINPVLGSEVSW